MKVNNIRLAGCTNTLDWCIANHAELKDNLPLVSIINDETFFIIEIGGINFYQVFRLSQLYRNRLRICNVEQAAIPDQAILEDYFPGNGPMVEQLLGMFTGIVSQMVADNDIVLPWVPKLFLPMITTEFSIQIPFSFVDAIDVMSEDEINDIFTDNTYPSKLADLSNEGATHSMIRAIMIAIERSTGNIRYDPKYEKLLKLTKYFSLKADPTLPEPFKTGLIGFHKFDSLDRSICQASFFRPDQTKFASSLSGMKRINSPLEFSFAIQLPIYDMAMLEAGYFQDDLKITHRSSINSIVDNGMDLEGLTVGETNEMIDNYRVRLTEAQVATLKTIGSITNSEADFHPSAMFALLPPIYRTNAVITFSEDRLPMFTSDTNPTIQAMFRSIERSAKSIIDEINGPPTKSRT